MIEGLNSIWSKLGVFQDDLISLVFTLVAAAIFFTLRPKVKLIYGRAANSHNVISVPAPSGGDENLQTEIYIEKFFLQNFGRATATNVEFVLSNFPTDISVFQPRDMQYKKIEKGNCLISIPQISPKELVIIDCAYINQKAAFVTSVKCAECEGQEVPFWTVRKFPQSVYWAFQILLVLGVAQVMQLAVKLIG